MGGILAVLFWPLHEWLEKRKIPSVTGSALLTFGITVVLIMPSSILIFLTARTGFEQLQHWKAPPLEGSGILDSLIRLPGVHDAINWVTRRLPLDLTSFQATIHDLSASMGIWLAEFLGGALSHLPRVAMALGLIVVSVYFFLIDGKRWAHLIRTNTLFTAEQTDRLVKMIAEMCRSVILAAIISGSAQALVEFVACLITGVPNAAFIGLLVFVGSFIPIIGSSPITLFVATQQLLEGNQVVAIVLFIMVLVILGIDNTVRPLFLRGSAGLHPLLAFVAALGGLQTMGFFGVFIGPILAALFVFTFRILTHGEGSANSAASS